MSHEYPPSRENNSSNSSDERTIETGDPNGAFEPANDLRIELHHVVILICLGILGVSAVIHTFWEEFHPTESSATMEHTLPQSP